MQKNKEWILEVQYLASPWSEWFKEYDLIPPTYNGTSLLIVPDHKHISILKDLAISSKVFFVARKLYPNIKTLIPVSGMMYEKVKDGTLELI